MRHRWAALCVLALGALAPTIGQAQASQDPPPARERPGVELGQNYPNPFNPTTTIPFVIGDPATCQDTDREHVVTLRIYNILAQLVAVPVLQGAGQQLLNVRLKCGSYTAYWDGHYLDSSREVASGVYLYRIEVDGEVKVKKMIVSK